MHGKHSICSPISTVKWLAALAIATACAGTARAAVFSDSFNNGSTLDPSTYPAVTSTSTGYDVLAVKTTTATLNPGELQISTAASSSDIAEVQALFTNTPITLSSAGQYVELSTTFTWDSASSGSPAATYFGLYNSGQVAPTNTLTSAGMSSSSSTNASGNAAGWTGYIEQLMATASSHIATRPAQSAGDNTDQDLLGNGVSTSSAYNHPKGTVLETSSTGAVQTLGLGDTYTEDLIVSLTATGPDSISVTSNLYAGDTDTGTPLATQTGVDASATTTTFDSFAMGWRETADTGVQDMDYNSVTVTTGTVPEPASLGLVALGGLALLRRRKQINAA